MAKSAKIKNFSIEQILKTNGIEIQIDDKDGQFGDIYVTKTGIIWCKGKTERSNGVKFTFDQIQSLSKFKKDVLNAAKQAAKAAK